jgi:type IV secretion system protein VirB9
MKCLLPFSLLLLSASCATVDVEKNVLSSSIGGGNPASEIASSVVVEPEIIIVEMPVFVPPASAPPRAPAAGQPSVRASNAEGVLQPSDYSHAAVVYEYNPDVVYEVYCQPLRVTDVCLEPNEAALEPPFVSDSERWVLGGGSSFEAGQNVQHIYIKPVSSGLSASLIINTNKRVYRLILRSYADVHMPLVRWRYNSSLPQNFSFLPAAGGSRSDSASASAGLDPQFLSFNYRITHSIFKKPYWLPDLVFDDGAKTYIRFPSQVLQRELPAVFENRRYVLNYRAIGNLIVIDKLIEEISLKIEKTEITVRKKRG